MRKQRRQLDYESSGNMGSKNQNMKCVENVNGKGIIGSRGMMQNEFQDSVWCFGTNAFVCNDDGCVSVALANAVALLFNKGKAKEVYDYLMGREIRYKTLKQIFNVTHEMPVAMTVRRIVKRERQAFSTDPFKWLCSKKSGVWMVRVTQRGVVDHCVVINAERGLIHDSASPYPLSLSDNVLRSCGGTAADKLEISEVRELIRQPTSWKGNKKRRRERASKG